jgi:hypothetical protein
MTIALGRLDEEVSKSKNLRKAAPVKIVAVGGYVAVSYLRNRTSTEDINYKSRPQLARHPGNETRFPLIPSHLALNTIPPQHL